MSLFFYFFQNNELLKNSVGLSKIMLANGADNSAIYSF